MIVNDGKLYPEGSTTFLGKKIAVELHATRKDHTQMTQEEKTPQHPNTITLLAMPYNSKHRSRSFTWCVLIHPTLFFSLTRNAPWCVLIHPTVTDSSSLSSVTDSSSLSSSSGSG